MIYHRLTVRTCARHASVVTCVVVGVCAVVFFSRLLSDIAVNALPFEVLWRLLPLTLIKYTPQMLILSVFAGVLLTVRQFFMRREMDAWFSAGLGLRHFIAPVLLFSLPGALFVGAFSLYGSPWSVGNMAFTRNAAVFGVDVANLPRERFGAVPGGSHVYFWDDGGDIFVAGNDPRWDEIIIAREVGRVNDNTIQFKDGRLFSLVTAGGDADTMEFDTLRLSFPAAAAGMSTRATPSSALRWRVAADRAELIWRVNLPIAAVVLALAALFLGRVSPQFGGRQNLLIAIALFFIYLNLLRYFKQQMEDAVLPAVAALLAPPLLIVALLTLAALFSHRR